MAPVYSGRSAGRPAGRSSPQPLKRTRDGALDEEQPGGSQLQSVKRRTMLTNLSEFFEARTTRLERELEESRSAHRNLQARCARLQSLVRSRKRFE